MSDSLGNKLSARAFMGLFGGTSGAASLNIWRDMQVVVCLFAQISSGTPLVWHFIEYQRQDVSSCVFFPVVLALRQRIHLWSCFTVHSSGFSRGKITQAHLLSSASHFHVFYFQFHLPFCYFEFHFAFRHVCLHSRPPINPISARAPSLGPRLSLFSEVSYNQMFLNFCQICGSGG